MHFSNFLSATTRRLLCMIGRSNSDKFARNINNGFSFEGVSYQSSDEKMSGASNIPSEHLVWIDMEMTGLDISKDHILEVSCIITDGNLDIVHEGPDLVIHHTDEILRNMDPWCVKTHAKSGLTDASRKSDIGVKDAERIFLNFLKQHVPQGKCPAAGNTVYMDRLFLRYHMPDVNNYLHYRNVDVSSIKELCRRWYPSKFISKPRKKFNHRALEDIQESIEELKYYRSAIFK